MTVITIAVKFGMTVDTFYIYWVTLSQNSCLLHRLVCHSAVDLRTYTDAELILCSVCIEELVGGLLRSICFEKSVSLNQFDVLLRVCGRHYLPTLSSGACIYAALS